jgi:hypothetical protein
LNASFLAISLRLSNVSISNLSLSSSSPTIGYNF